MQRRRVMLAGKKPKLTPEYQKVEYLYANGYQFLITDIRAYDISKIIIKSMPTASDGFILSTTYGMQYKGINFYMDSNNQRWYYYPKTAIIQGAYNQISTAIFDVRFENGTAKSSIATIDGISTPEFFFPKIPIDALICLGSANGSYGFHGRIYESIFYRNATTAGDFVPCYRKSDNKPGMYDLCGSICPLTNSPFYINAGTGEFLAGPDVN